MLKNISIRTKLTTLIFLLVLLTVCTAGLISFSLRKVAIKNSSLKELKTLSIIKKDRIQRFFDTANSDLELVAGQEAVQQLIGMMGNDKTKNSTETTNTVPRKKINKTLYELQQYIGAKNIIVTDIDGEVIMSTGAVDSNIKRVTNDLEDKFLQQSKATTTFSQILKSEDDYFMAVGSPVTGQGSHKALCFLLLSLEPLYVDLQDDMGIGQSLETILAEKRGNIALYLNPTKFHPDATINMSVGIGSKHGTAIQQAVLGNDGIGYSIDDRGIETLSVWSYIPQLKWGLEIKIDQSEIDQQAFIVIRKFTIWGSVILVLTLLVSSFFAQYFTQPILSLKEALIAVSQGILPNHIPRANNDEIGQMATATNDLVQVLQRTANFAKNIGEKDLTAEFKPSSQNDVLGNALINMRNGLIEAEQQDAERIWIVNGIAEISEILRSNDRLDELSDAVIMRTAEKIDAVQSAFYLVNDDTPSDVFIELKAAYAYNKKKFIEGRYEFSQGLVGQAAVEKNYILRTEIPEDYVSITSGILGDRRPSCILIVPLITDEKVYGVMEFAGFHKFTESQIKFIEEISLIISRTIFNLKVNERTRSLLKELQEQQEVLRQNSTDMAFTQEKLKRTNLQLTDQIEEVNRSQNRMQLLLENASEVIAIYEQEGTIRYISPSVEKILGFSQNDLIGANDKQNVDSDGLMHFEQLFANVIKNPFEIVTAQYEYKKKNGKTVWLEATATNLLSDPAIQGIVLNSRDITEKRRAEREERMKSKMQALSENSPDLITRISKKGEVFYINPMIENYTGHKRADILNRQLTEIEVDDRIKEEWAELLQQVDDSHMKIKKEMDFPTVVGNRIMQVNAIPEFDDGDILESVLVVSHDITERKQIELEIQSKNKKITESINYAKRIQEAIIPNNDVIHQVLPDSFILNRAKDMVSGDFPWFIHDEDTIIFAAVDCTGHGVPGALISLIGFFLLNDIVKGKKISDPGKILDLLDRGVTKTLRQNTDTSKAKDGMDIALCKIETSQNRVTYAGAHRPLYHISNGELIETKGNKFPIGGGVYRNQTKFTNTVIDIKSGDSIFFGSDGFTDQFGGPNNRKYGSRRLRESLIKYHQHSMADISKKMEEDWKEWQGREKQTDDVLLIGVRL